MKRQLLFAFCWGVLICACGGGSQSTDPGHPGGDTVSVSITPANPSLEIGATQQFTANVTGTSNHAVTWTLSGSQCNANVCGFLDPNGLYIAPDDPPTPATFSITAVSQADASKSAVTNVTITTTSNHRFSDQYAILLNGFEGTGNPVAIAASFSTDGNGAVNAGGVMDLNRLDDVQQTIQVTGGSYAYGADNRGRLILSTDRGDLSFRFAMNATNPPTFGRLISFQPDGVLTGSGLIKKQSSSAFSISAFNGDFAMGLSGATTNAARAGSVGRFTLHNPSGVIDSSNMDFNLSGTPSANQSCPGNYSISPATGAGNGRGTARLNCPLGTLNFSFYIVSATEAFFIGLDLRTDALPALIGQALKQSGGPYTPSSMTGPMAFNATGISGGSVVTIGRFDATPPNLSGTLDRNFAGVITSNAAFTGTYDVVANGRGTLNFQVSNMDDTRYVFYMVRSNPAQAFLLESESLAVGVGSMEAQSGGPFNNASLSGNWVLGTANPATCGCSSVSGVVTLNGTGNFVGSRDRRTDAFFPRDAWTGTFAVTSNGRGTLTTATPSPESFALYVTSANKFVTIDVDDGLHTSVVTVFEK
jgi:hypothetical protein